MIKQKRGKIPLNLAETGKSTTQSKDQAPAKSPKLKGDLDKLIGNSLVNTGSKGLQMMNALNESSSHISDVSSQLFQNLGIVTLNSNQPSTLSLIKRVELYLTRFPEIEYLIDMLASSIIYTSSSNTKKIQVTLNGEHKTVEKQSKTITPDSTSTDSTGQQENEAPNVDIEQIVFNENVEKVDSYYKDMSIEIGNLFKKNNIKLSLYNLMFLELNIIFHFLILIKIMLLTITLNILYSCHYLQT